MGLPVVLMPGPMHPAVAQGLEGHCELIRLWEESDPDAVLAARRDEIVAVATGGGRIDGPFLDRLPAVRIVASFGVGYDRIDANAAAERGVVVTNTPGVLDDEVADTALGLLLMAVRELPQAERYLREGKWQDGPYPLTRATMHGRRMGILGLGRIGQAIADRVTPFGISVAYHNRRRKDVGYRYYPSLVEMARDVDILMIVIPGGDSTRHLVDAEVLRGARPGRHPDQRLPRLGRRRAGAGRRSAHQHDPVRRPGRLRARAEGPPRPPDPPERRPAPPRRLGHHAHPHRDGQPGRRQSPQLAGPRHSADPGPGVGGAGPAAQRLRVISRSRRESFSGLRTA